MSAERLREAAALMRERAERAAESLHQSYDWTGIGTGYREPIKEHIGSWGIVPALAVADWLETVAVEKIPTAGYAVTHLCTVIPCSHDGKWPCAPTASGKAALAVANAYLGGAQ